MIKKNRYSMYFFYTFPWQFWQNKITIITMCMYRKVKNTHKCPLLQLHTAVAAVCLSQEIYICQSELCWLLSILQSAFKLNPFYSHGVTEQWHFADKFINHYKLTGWIKLMDLEWMQNVQIYQHLYKYYKVV